MNKPISEIVNEKLLAYQIPHKLQMLEALNIRKRVLDASDTGTGKTYVAIALCKELGLEPFIICPKSVIPIWDDVCKFFNVEYFGISNYEMLKNCRYYTKDYIPTKCPYMDKFIDGILQENINIKKDNKKHDKKINSEDDYDSNDSNNSENESEDEKLVKIKKNKVNKVNKENKENKKEETKKSKPKIKFQFYLPDNVIIIFDEAHRCKNTSSLTSKLLEGFNDCKNKIMILSATITDKIKCFSPFGMFFGFYDSPKRFKMWIKKEEMYYKMKNKNKNIGSISPSYIIHNKIFPEYGSRMKVKELIEAKLFPETQIQANCYYLENHLEIDKLYHEINNAVLDYTVKEMLAEQLPKLIYCRQRMEMLKMPIFFDLIDEGLSDGKSIVVFVNYVESLNYICYHLKQKLKSKYDSEISVIIGGQSIQERKENLDDFQSNKTRLIIIMTQAGGVGLSCHDVNGTHPRLAIISPTWSGDQMKQILGRVHRAGGSGSIQKIVYVAKTYEEKICKLIKNKLEVIDTINDGDLGGTKIDKKSLELENETKINENEKISKYMKGENIDSIGVNDNSTIEERLTKIHKKKVKKSQKDTKNIL